MVFVSVFAFVFVLVIFGICKQYLYSLVFVEIVWWEDLRIGLTRDLRPERLKQQHHLLQSIWISVLRSISKLVLLKVFEGAFLERIFSLNEYS